MSNQSNYKLKLGIFVTTAIVLFILALYYIGSKKNIFHTTINVSATFNNVNGLLSGNNVRFNGINVGTVSEVYAIADTIIKVDFTIDEDVTQYISMDAIISIGTDGLLGNKLVNIEPGKGKGGTVQEGSVFITLHSLQMDNALRTLSKTSSNLEFITSDLKNITHKINNSNSLWSLFSDTVMAENVKSSIVNIKMASNSSAVLTGNLKNVSENIMKGKGSIGALLTDTTLSGKINQVIVKLEKVSDTMAIIFGDFSKISGRLEKGQGSVGVLLKDTTFVHNLNTSMNNINKGSITLNEDLEALKHSFLLKRYFKKQEKRNQKNK
ncbi:MAG: MCE family protein [Bacteroidetes bacterium]|nr:MCE family protein [Bacteroidota bacterium]